MLYKFQGAMSWIDCFRTPIEVAHGLMFIGLLSLDHLTLYHLLDLDQTRSVIFPIPATVLQALVWPMSSKLRSCGSLAAGNDALLAVKTEQSKLDRKYEIEEKRKVGLT